MWSCVLCEKSDEYLFISKFCSKCRRIKHHLSLSGDRVYEVLECVLSRDVNKQNNKINAEIKNEIENKKFNLKSNKLDDSTYTKNNLP